MAAAARDAYRDLVERTPGFLDYWRAATPIDEISRLRLGSRPTARRAGALTRGDVRAIPWVFSWMQSRFNLPGLVRPRHRARRRRRRTCLREMYAGWPFFRAILDNAEMSLLKADMGIAALYSDLVPDPGWPPPSSPGSRTSTRARARPSSGDRPRRADGRPTRSSSARCSSAIPTWTR